MTEKRAIDLNRRARQGLQILSDPRSFFGPQMLRQGQRWAGRAGRDVARPVVDSLTGRAAVDKAVQWGKNQAGSYMFQTQWPQVLGYSGDPDKFWDEHRKRTTLGPQETFQAYQQYHQDLGLPSPAEAASRYFSGQPSQDLGPMRRVLQPEGEFRWDTYSAFMNTLPEEDFRKRLKGMPGQVQDLRSQFEQVQNTLAEHGFDIQTPGMPEVGQYITKGPKGLARLDYEKFFDETVGKGKRNLEALKAGLGAEDMEEATQRLGEIAQAAGPYAQLFTSEEEEGPGALASQFTDGEGNIREERVSSFYDLSQQLEGLDREFQDLNREMGWTGERAITPEKAVGILGSFGAGGDRYIRDGQLQTAPLIQDIQMGRQVLDALPDVEGLKEMHGSGQLNKVVQKLSGLPEEVSSGALSGFKKRYFDQDGNLRRGEFDRDMETLVEVKGYMPDFNALGWNVGGGGADLSQVASQMAAPDGWLDMDRARAIGDLGKELREFTEEEARHLFGMNRKDALQKITEWGGNPNKYVSENDKGEKVYDFEAATEDIRLGNDIVDELFRLGEETEGLVDPETVQQMRGSGSLNKILLALGGREDADPLDVAKKRWTDLETGQIDRELMREELTRFTGLYSGVRDLQKRMGQFFEPNEMKELGVDVGRMATDYISDEGEIDFEAAEAATNFYDNLLDRFDDSPELKDKFKNAVGFFNRLGGIGFLSKGTDVALTKGWGLFADDKGNITRPGMLDALVTLGSWGENLWKKLFEEQDIGAWLGVLGAGVGAIGLLNEILGLGGGPPQGPAQPQPAPTQPPTPAQATQARPVARPTGLGAFQLPAEHLSEQQWNQLLQGL